MLLFTSIALITLFERKILAYSQIRIGPNKTTLRGLLQPLIDGIKLLYKDFLSPLNSIKDLFYFGPSLLIISITMMWSCQNTTPFHSSFWAQRLFFILLLRLGVYGIFLVGLSSASKYSFIGGIRRCTQSIRYEVRFAIVIFSIIILHHHVRFPIWGRSLFILCLPLWLIRVIAETNRAPLDLTEGERELIRGLNIELSGVLFAFVFVGEYGIVVAFSWLSRILFFRNNFFFTLFIIFIILIIRRSLPRLRYDKLISFCWTRILPVSILWTLFCVITTQL